MTENNNVEKILAQELEAEKAVQRLIIQALKTGCKGWVQLNDCQGLRTEPIILISKALRTLVAHCVVVEGNGVYRLSVSVDADVSAI